MNRYPTIPLWPVREVGAGAEGFCRVMEARRSVRMFSPEPVALETIEWCVRAAGTAPSGANKQPWRFVCVRDAGVKAGIRAAAEAEEREFYARRANPQWLADLAPLETTPDKAFLEEAPWVVVVFKLVHGDDGGQMYYVNESVGIAVGLFIAAVHHAGLCTLTHTPSPMGFLSEVLGRPGHERPFLLLPVGKPAPDARVPDIARKSLAEIMVVR